MSNVEVASGIVPTDPSTVSFEYIKSADFRTVWADGAVGGVTPTGLIHFAVYSERPAIPRRQVFEVADDEGGGKRLGPELLEKRVSRDGFVREMPVDVMLSVNVAESLAQWLMQQVEIVKKGQHG